MQLAMAIRCQLGDILRYFPAALKHAPKYQVVSMGASYRSITSKYLT